MLICYLYLLLGVAIVIVYYHLYFVGDCDDNDAHECVQNNENTLEIYPYISTNIKLSNNKIFIYKLWLPP